MAQTAEAIRFRTDFEQALIDYGQTITRNRPAYRDTNGNEIGRKSGRLRCLNVLPTTITVQGMSHAGLDNMNEPNNRNTLYFSGRADIREDDEIEMNGWVNTITLCIPFVMADIRLVWVAYYKRDRRV